MNDEIGALRSAVSDMIDCLSTGGRIAVITFHSLEDRAVKETFAERVKGCTCPSSFPVCVCGFKPTLTAGKSVVADKGELSENNRSRSARLRFAEKL